MAISNLIDLTEGSTSEYGMSLTNRDSGIRGAVVTILDRLYNNKSRDHIWSEIIDANAAHDGICYVASATVGSHCDTYIGKTLNTMGRRYPNGPTGGLGQVFATYTGSGFQSLSVTLYNVSNPATIEGWCYQIASQRNAQNPAYRLVNIQDPS